MCGQLSPTSYNSNDSEARAATACVTSNDETGARRKCSGRLAGTIMPRQVRKTRTGPIQAIVTRLSYGG